MPAQLWLFYLFLALAAVVAAVFSYVVWTTREPREVSQEAVQRTRFTLFVLLSLVLVSALGFTLARVPYDLFEGEVPDRVIFAAGKQFAFALSESPIRTDEEYQARAIAPPVTVPAGSLVELRVSSFDVNHSMGLYDPEGILIAQLQAMPGYLNRLRVRLDRPGRYDLFCLELCGNGHARMRGTIEVLPGA